MTWLENLINRKIKMVAEEDQVLNENHLLSDANVDYFLVRKKNRLQGVISAHFINSIKEGNNEVCFKDYFGEKNFIFIPTNVEIVKLLEDINSYPYYVAINQRKEPVGVVKSCDVFKKIARLQREDLEKLQEKYKELDAVFTHSVDDLFVTDGKGNVTRVNPISEWHCGMTAEDIVGKNVKTLVEEKVFYPSVTLEVLRTGKECRLLQTLSNGKILIVTGTPVFDDNGEIFRVITNTHDYNKIEGLRYQLEQVEKLNQLYKAELKYLRTQEINLEQLVFKSEKMQSIFGLVMQICEADCTVLISGASGSGKEVIAKSLHQLSKRKGDPFIKVNCGAIPENLLESEMFGYEGGTFTGAKKEGKIGLIELADGGTLFLDEIGDMRYDLQVKLLHFLQEKKFARVGSSKEISVDVRIVAASNKDLSIMVDKGLFREDLYFRLNVVPIHIPPLKERVEDIPPLTAHFIEKNNKKYNLNKSISKETQSVLNNYHWPGNVRELENIVERLVLTTKEQVVFPHHLPRHFYHYNEMEIKYLKDAVEETERDLIKAAYNKYKNTYKVAKALGIAQSTAVRKIHKYTKEKVDWD